MIALIELHATTDKHEEGKEREKFVAPIWLRADLIEGLTPSYDLTVRGDIAKGAAVAGTVVTFQNKPIYVTEKPDDILARLGALVAHAAEVGQ